MISSGKLAILIAVVVVAVVAGTSVTLTMALLSLGVIFMAIGAVGVVKMPDFMNRFHASTIIATFGAIFLCGAVAWFGVSTNQPQFVKSAIMLVVAIMFTGATGSHAIARASFISGNVPQNLKHNDFEVKKV